MKLWLTALALTALLTPHGFAALKRDQPQAILARVTVYWASGGCGSDRFTRQHKCATGTRLRIGHCAVDPKRIAYGSNIVFPDGSTLAAVDTGTAVRNRKAARLSGRSPFERNAVVIDRFFETKRQALNWAATHPLFMAVRVVPPNQSLLANSPGRFHSVRRAVALNSPLSSPTRSTIGPRFAALQPSRVR
ncbi:MAG: hypothetical protein QOH39_79 [Verrucomicrobiota bacterium]|jgi:3D (Asp-Asp-Asp) domain-containing protein